MAGTEEIYETNDDNDDKCSLFDENYWYENDLVLAAELGKTLLERNKNLEFQLNVEAKETVTLRMEIDLLKKQLETLRELNRNKMKLYEDVDKHCHDLEMRNEEIVEENKKYKDKINILMKKNEYLEQQIEELQSNISEERPNHQRIPITNHLTITSSSPNSSIGSHSNTPSPSPSSVRQHDTEIEEMEKLWQNKVNQLELDIESRDNKINELQNDVVQLSYKLKRVETELEDYCNAYTCQEEKYELEQEVQTNQSIPKSNTLVEDIYNSLEYDIEKVDENPVEVGLLQSGGRVMSGRKSLQSLGIILQPPSPPSSELDPKSPKVLQQHYPINNMKSQNQVSILNELESQYNTLVQQYSELMNNKMDSQQSSGICSKCSSITTGVSPTTTCPDSSKTFHEKLDNIFSEETRRQRKMLTTQNYRPKYKELFRDAFDLLKDMKHNTSTTS